MIRNLTDPFKILTKFQGIIHHSRFLLDIANGGPFFLLFFVTDATIAFHRLWNFIKKGHYWWDTFFGKPRHMAKILWIPCCLFCSHSIIFWVKKLPLDPPQVRCYCQTFFEPHDFFQAWKITYILSRRGIYFDHTYLDVRWVSVRFILKSVLAKFDKKI